MFAGFRASNSLHVYYLTQILLLKNVASGEFLCIPLLWNNTIRCLAVVSTLETRSKSSTSVFGGSSLQCTASKPGYFTTRQKFCPLVWSLECGNVTNEIQRSTKFSVFFADFAFFLFKLRPRGDQVWDRRPSIMVFPNKKCEPRSCYRKFALLLEPWHQKGEF